MTKKSEVSINDRIVAATLHKSWLDGKLAKEELNTLQDLTVAINRILSNVPDHLNKNLVESMPNRIHECLKAHGGITRY